MALIVHTVFANKSGQVGTLIDRGHILPSSPFPSRIDDASETRWKRRFISLETGRNRDIGTSHVERLVPLLTRCTDGVPCFEPRRADEIDARESAGYHLRLQPLVHLA